MEAATPRAVIREAVAVGWLEDGNLWSEMLQKRNLTRHTCDDELARAVYAFVCAEARPAFEQLAQRIRQWG